MKPAGRALVNTPRFLRAWNPVEEAVTTDQQSWNRAGVSYLTYVKFECTFTLGSEIISKFPLFSYSAGGAPEIQIATSASHLRLAFTPRCCASGYYNYSGGTKKLKAVFAS